MPTLMDGSGGMVDPAQWLTLGPGEYTFALADQRGCTLDTAFALNSPLELTASVSPAGCGGLGLIEAEASGGAGDVTWGVVPNLSASISDGSMAQWEDVPAGA